MWGSTESEARALVLILVSDLRVGCIETNHQLDMGYHSFESLHPRLASRRERRRKADGVNDY